MHTRVLVGRASVAEGPGAETGERAEPWVVAVLVGDGSPLARRTSQVQRVLRGGLAGGITVVLVDVPMTIGAPLETGPAAVGGRRGHEPVVV